MYMCADPANYLINGPATNMCNGDGAYVNPTAPTCERGKLLRCIKTTQHDGQMFF